MRDRDIHEINAWLIECGLAGEAENVVLDGLCDRLAAAGVPLSRALVLIDTLHPTHEGRAFQWLRDKPPESVIEYGRTNEGQGRANWERSPWFHMLQTGEDEFRRKWFAGEPRDDYIFNYSEGQYDYLAFVHRFAGEHIIGEMDCLYSNWMTDNPKGFGDDDVVALRRLVPALALAIKCSSLAQIAGTLVEVYLGQDAGQRVLKGRIMRGVADRISAVLWFSDLRGYTTITDRAAPDEIIPLLNDYAGVVISAIHNSGGDVLKLMGDGVLAIFKADNAGDACASALRAEAAVRETVGALNVRRAEAGRPVTNVYLGLHIGEVFYGNIGSDERLDFTVVGPAVNEVSRIASICRSVDRHLVVSSEFAEQAPQAQRERLVSLGRYALRGVGRAQELFTLDPGVL